MQILEQIDFEAGFWAGDKSIVMRSCEWGGGREGTFATMIMFAIM